ncbi:N-acetyltransferase [uncultured Litoreibacter sp.]|uniref:GNAT family N-acetyltransferase n=1 Tax=uncultured Litoreibacter sp. TaxID=1392394 RepID=UPI002638109B|nr:GNAT family N-acetyltransferase [uncultured Litoreibacter sp.]
MDRASLMQVVEATWPPERQFSEGPWVFRQSKGGGKRVTAASSDQEVGKDDIRQAEARMAELGQPVLFTLSPDHNFDPILAELGYELVDRTRLYHAEIDGLAAREVPPVTAFPIWPPLQLARDIWAEGGVGPDRVAIMERAECDKTCILGRVNDRAGGAVYVGLHNGCVMVHALEILETQRRFGLATSLMVAAAQWGAERGATDIALLVTAQNAGANALYASLGMAAQDGYHYRVKR